MPVLCLIVLSGCLKDKPNVDFSNLGYIAEISTSNVNPTLNAPSSGYANFNGASLSFATAPDPDTVTFTVNIASDYPPTKDIPVTVAIDPTALAKYNSDTVTNAARIQFSLFPDSTFTFTTTTGVIKAGQRLDTFYVIFSPGKIDPTQTYMLPISITSAPGTTISGNLSTIYFHAIGNPIAGVYNQEWIRYNSVGMTGTPVYDVQEGSTFFTPISPTEIGVYSGTGMLYQLSFTNTAGVLSDFNATFPSSGAGSATANGITITSGPTVVLADPINHVYTLNFTYLNGSGAARNITDKFTP